MRTPAYRTRGRKTKGLIAPGPAGYCTIYSAGLPDHHCKLPGFYRLTVHHNFLTCKNQLVIIIETAAVKIESTVRSDRKQ
jgi:hypothetical protein